MQHRRIARNLGRGSKRINPVVRKEFRKVATHLNQRINEPLNSETLTREAERLYKLCPFRYDQSAKSIPQKAINGMAHFLILKTAQRKNFTNSELGTLARITNLVEHTATWKPLITAFSEIGKQKLETLLTKLDALRDLPSLEILATRFYDSQHGTELRHITSASLPRARAIIDSIKAHIETWLKEKAI